MISYVDAHDNETLWDTLTYKLPTAMTMPDRIRMNTVSLATTALAQTPSFWHAGADLLRSKSLDRNSYNSGDWFNTLDWTGADNGFGHGLPPKADNEAKWPYMKPLLANPALKPTAADVATASAAAADLLKLRFSTPLFRLGSADLINAEAHLPVERHHAWCDHDADRRHRRPERRPGAQGRSGRLQLHWLRRHPAGPGPGRRQRWRSPPSRPRGSDPVVKQTTWTASSGTVTVPARTVAVLIQR